MIFFRSLLSRFGGIKEPLHPGFFPGRSVFLDNTFLGGSIYLLDHVFQSRFRIRPFGWIARRFLGQNDKFFRAGPDRRLYRLIPEPALLALSVPLFGGRNFLCQKKPPLFEVGWPAFHPFAFVTFRQVLDFAVLKNGFHFDFSTA